MADKDTTKNKLKDRHKQVVIDMIAGGFGNDEIAALLLSDYDIKITGSGICFYRMNRKDDILEARKKFEDRMFEIVPMASKVARIVKRQKMVEDLAKADIEKNHQGINKILDSIREEMTPKKALTFEGGETEDGKPWEIIIREIDVNGKESVHTTTAK